MVRTTVLVAYEQRGPQFYSSARACLWARIREGWYDSDTEAEAMSVLGQSGDAVRTEMAAWRFLSSRSSRTFERVELHAIAV